MMTRIKQWLQKLFSWWRWWDDPEPTDIPAEPTNRGISVDPVVRPSLDDTFPRQGVVPQLGSQGEPRRSTMENWRMPDPLIHPYAPVPDEDWGLEFPFSVPAPQIESEREKPLPPAASEKPEVEQHLEFLRYLVRRGIVNEGFPEDQMPEQYRENRKK